MGGLVLYHDMLFNLPLIAIAGILATMHCIIGLIAAIAAKRRGLNFRRWLGLGLLGGTIALIAVLRQPKPTVD